MPGINHTPEPFTLFSMDDVADACVHAGGGSLSRGPWNKYDIKHFVRVHVLEQEMP